MSVTTLVNLEYSGGKSYTVFRFDSTGTSEVINFADTPLITFSMQCEIPSGLMISTSILLEGSVSGNSWDTVLSLTNIADLAKIKVSNSSLCAYYRVRLTTLTIGTAPYVDVHILGVS